MPVDPPVAANPGRTNSSTWLHTSSTATTPDPASSTSDQLDPQPDPQSDPQSDPQPPPQPSGATSFSAMAPSSGSYYPPDSGADSALDDDYDYDDDDQDSAYGGDSFIGDDTKTLSCYITDYRFEYGRRYHSYRDGAYWGPNDEIANEQQDVAHHMYNLTLDGKLHFAPLQNPQIESTNPCSDMADEYPSAKVTGVDLSPIQPSFVPPNCIFEIDDMTLPWTYPPNQFDFIHVREMFGCIPDWDDFFSQCFNCLRPGGYVEVVEHSVEPTADDGSVGPGHFYELWGQTVVQAGLEFGKSFTIWRESAERLKRAGFEDVVEIEYKWPMNGWSSDPKMHELGRWNQFRLHNGVEGFMLRLLTSTLQWPYDRAQIFLAQMRAALRDYKTPAYLPGTVVYARKPGASTPC